MKSVWREYGVIGTLLVVAVGGYLYVSRNKPDMLAASLDTIGGHLLSLVPEGGGRSDVQAALDTLERRVKTGEVEPEQIERYAASVFNLGTSGEPLAPKEAEMVVRLAYSDPAVLTGPEGQALPAPRKNHVVVRAEDLERLASELGPMVAFYETVKGSADSTGPAYRFYSDGKLHVVVDDRMRERVESDAAARPLIRDKSMSWRARFTEAAAAEKLRHMEHTEQLAHMAASWADSLDIGKTTKALYHISRLRSLGFVPEESVDSMVSAIEIEVKAILSDLPSPPPVPDRESTSTSVSSSSRSSTG